MRELGRRSQPNLTGVLAAILMGTPAGPSSVRWRVCPAEVGRKRIRPSFSVRRRGFRSCGGGSLGGCHSGSPYRLEAPPADARSKDRLGVRYSGRRLHVIMQVADDSSANPARRGEATCGLTVEPVIESPLDSSKVRAEGLPRPSAKPGLSATRAQ